MESQEIHKGDWGFSSRAFCGVQKTNKAWNETVCRGNDPTRVILRTIEMTRWACSTFVSNFSTHTDHWRRSTGPKNVPWEHMSADVRSVPLLLLPTWTRAYRWANFRVSWHLFGYGLGAKPTNQIYTEMLVCELNRTNWRVREADRSCRVPVLEFAF